RPARSSRFSSEAPARFAAEARKMTYSLLIPCFCTLTSRKPAFHAAFRATEKKFPVIFPVIRHSSPRKPQPSLPHLPPHFAVIYTQLVTFCKSAGGKMRADIPSFLKNRFTSNVQPNGVEAFRQKRRRGSASLLMVIATLLLTLVTAQAQDLA